MIANVRRVVVPALMAMVAACSGGAPAATPAPQPADPYRIAISGFKFQPATLTVPAGTTVTWENLDTTPHTVTSAALGERWDSGKLSHHGTYSRTFTTPGRYQYLCVPHPGMQGVIIVE